ncbi:TPA: hypothetical protein PF073_000773 [Staphylococcus aureus]|nr:hypothetical protein [Staphylococcus aureus]
MTETTFNPITSLTINNEEVKAKATFMFDKTAKKFATEQEDNKGRKQKTSGFTNVYNALLERDTVAIVDFWECATAYLGKSTPKREDIEAEIMEIIERENDTLNLLQGALDVMNNSGFFKQKSRLFWTQMNQAPSLAKEDEKEGAKAGIEMMKNNYKEIMTVAPY